MSNVVHSVSQLNVYLEAGKVPEFRRSFAKSLIDQGLKKGELSDKQFFWVRKILAEVEGRAGPSGPVPQPVPNAGRLFELFGKASKALKRPSIRLQLQAGRVLKMHVAGATSKYQGDLQVSELDNFGVPQFLGRVDKAGNFVPFYKAPAAVREEGFDLICSFANDPAEAAKGQGHMSGFCCFCSRRLDTKESVSVGYGPICADRWGLPWGHVAEPKQAEVVA